MKYLYSVLLHLAIFHNRDGAFTKPQFSGGVNIHHIIVLVYTTQVETKASVNHFGSLRLCEVSCTLLI